MTDSAFLYHCLEDGKWHGQAQILAKSMVERGHGLTVHSRAADLRKKGCVIECELRRNGHGRALSYYRLVALNEPAGAAAVGTASSLAGSLSVPAAALSPPCADEPSPPFEDGALFSCEVDESAGVRGAYWENDAA